jgi:hypothetical protein
MAETKGAALADRLKTAAEAKAALLAKFKPKPTAVDPAFAERGLAEAAAELKGVRAERQAARAVRRRAGQAAAAIRGPGRGGAEGRAQARQGADRRRGQGQARRQIRGSKVAPLMTRI